MKRYAVHISLFLATIMAQLPLWANPSLFLLRDNDLENFFTPLFLLYRTSFIESHVLPLWNPLWFGGQPFISDPQSLIIYPTQVLFLLLPISLSIITNIWIHSLIGAYLSYLFFSKHVSKNAATVIAICFIFSTRLAAAIEAGHYGIILAWAWIPGVFLCAHSISKNFKLLTILCFSVVVAFLVQTHMITGLIAIFFATLYAIWISKQKVKTLLGILITGVVSFGLLAIVFIPQISWQPITTRDLLLGKPEIYPVWQSKIEFFNQLIPERGLSNTKDTEKVIGIGIVILFIAFTHFLQISVKQKIGIVILGLFLGLLVSNNLSPLSPIVSAIPFIQLMRVTTRVWPIFIFLTLFLVGKFLSRMRNKYAFSLLAILCIANSYVLYIHVLSRVPNTTKPEIENVYTFLKSDPDTFRVYCIDRCFKQNRTAENKIEMIDGYATLTQKNYYQKSWSLFGGYWDYYTLAIPPFGISESLALNPDYDLLGEMNVKYIVSPIKLSSKFLEGEKIIDTYYVYQNVKFRPRLYLTDSTRAKIMPVTYTRHSALKYTITNVTKGTSLVFSEIYSPGWKVNGQLLNEAPSNIMSYEVKTEEDLVLEYLPSSFVIGRSITYFTVGFLLLLLFFTYFSIAKTTKLTINDSNVYMDNRVAQTSTSETRKNNAPKKVIKQNKAM